MPEIFSQLADKIAMHHVGLLALRDQCGKDELTLSSKLFLLLGVAVAPYNVSGMFGVNPLRTDGLISIGKSKFIAECKKVTEKTEYGFWHAAIQGLLYRCRENTTPIICFIFDWGRMAGQALPPEERAFLSRWSEEEIRFVRLSLSDAHFIEHNLLGEWISIC